MFVTIDRQIELFKSDRYYLSTDTISGKTRTQFDRDYPFDVFDLGNSKTTKRASSAFTFNQAYRPHIIYDDNIVISSKRIIHNLDLIEFFKDVVFNLDTMCAEIGGYSLRKNQFDTLFNCRLFILDRANLNHTHSAWKALLQSEGYRPNIKKGIGSSRQEIDMENI